MAEKKLSEDQILHLANLAWLSIESKESKKYANQLSEVLDYVASLQELDLKKVKETSQVTGLENITVEDEVGECLPRGKALSQAPETHQGYVKVEAVFGEKE